MDNIAGNIELVPIGQDSNVTELDRYQHAEPGARVSQANCKTFNADKRFSPRYVSEIFTIRNCISLKCIWANM